MMWRMALIIFGNISGATKTENRIRPRTRALPNENDGAPEQLRLYTLASKISTRLHHNGLISI